MHSSSFYMIHPRYLILNTPCCHPKPVIVVARLVVGQELLIYRYPKRLYTVLCRHLLLHKRSDSLPVLWKHGDKRAGLSFSSVPMVRLSRMGTDLSSLHCYHVS